MQKRTNNHHGFTCIELLVVLLLIVLMLASVLRCQSRPRELSMSSVAWPWIGWDYGDCCLMPIDDYDW